MSQSIQSFEPLTTAEEIASLCEEIRRFPMIAVDTEFIRESTFYPIVELIQVAHRDKSWVIDAQPFRGKGKAGLEPLFQILKSPDILKVMHASHGDQECLFSSYGVIATPTLDTSIGAGLLGMGESIGLSNLLKNLLGIRLSKGYTRSAWGKRPLPDHLLQYAHSDVLHLVQAAEILLQKLEAQGRKEWALELSSKSEDPALYSFDVTDFALRIGRGRKLDMPSIEVLYALADWRERRAQILNIPRRWVAEDSVLLDLSMVKPTQEDQLLQFRGLNKGEVKKSGAEILERIADPRKFSIPNFESRDIDSGSKPVSGKEESVMDLIKLAVAFLSDQEGIAPKYVLPSNKILAFIRCKDKNPETAHQYLVEQGVLHPKTPASISKKLLGIVNGEIGLGVRSGSLSLLEL